MSANPSFIILICLAFRLSVYYHLGNRNQVTPSWPEY